MYRKFVLLFSITALTAACGDGGKTPTTADAATTSDAQPSDTKGDTSADTTGGTDATTVSDTAGGDATAAKYTTCAAVGDCVVEACKTNAKDCEKACLAEGSAEAVGKAVPLLGCVQQECQLGLCKDSTETGCVDDCTGKKCGVPLMACIDDGKAGTGSCGDATACFDTCNTAKGKPMTCYADCYNKLSATAKADLGKMVGCIATKGTPESCVPEMFTCLLGGKSGDKGCHTAFGCMAGCSGDDSQGCLTKCAGELTKAGQAAFLAYLPCMGKDETPECKAKQVACIAPIGTDTCVQTMDCIGKCTTGEPGKDPGAGCLFECFHTATAESVALIESMKTCGQSGAGDAKCMDVMFSCAKPAGTLTCGQISSCMSKCETGTSCMFQCIQAAAPAGIADLKAAMACLDGCKTECKGDSACEGTCTDTKCKDLALKCVPS